MSPLFVLLFEEILSVVVVYRPSCAFSCITLYVHTDLLKYIRHVFSDASGNSVVF